MFVSNSEIGKIFTLARDIVMIKGTITKGSKVKVTAISNRGYDIIDIDSGEIAIEISTIWEDTPIFEEHK